MGRPIKVKNSVVVSIRFNQDEYNRVSDIAYAESQIGSATVSTHQLIRDAVTWVYGDNERLRESFRRTRERTTRKLYKRLEGNRL